MITQNKRLLIFLSTSLGILLIPLIAMAFTNEVDWKLSDFVIIGILLFGASLTVELIMRNVKKQRNRILFSVLTLMILLLIWAELAVGVFGTPFAGS